MKILSFLPAVIIYLAGFGVCRADTWQRAEVYLVDWETQTRVALTPERVREHAGLKRTFHKEAPGIARFLALEKLKPAKDKRPEDARLVVDLYTDTGTRVTYYASQFNLSPVDNTSRHPVDARFKAYFTQLTK